MKGNIVVSNFIDINKKDAVQKMELVKKLHDQFDDRQDMLFVFYDRSIKGTSAVDMKAFVEKHGITDHAQCIYLTGESASIQNLLQNGFKVPALDKERNVDQKYELSTALPADYPYFVLTDTTSMIRNYYNYKDHASMTRMIEHIAMILPRAPEKDIELRRDKEK